MPVPPHRLGYISGAPSSEHRVQLGDRQPQEQLPNSWASPNAPGGTCSPGAGHGWEPWMWVAAEPGWSSQSNQLSGGGMGHKGPGTASLLTLSPGAPGSPCQGKGMRRECGQPPWKAPCPQEPSLELQFPQGQGEWGTQETHQVGTSGCGLCHALGHSLSSLALAQAGPGRPKQGAPAPQGTNSQDHAWRRGWDPRGLLLCPPGCQLPQAWYQATLGQSPPGRLRP